jgi:putative peptidoglycan lipid II flippase
VTEKHHSLIRAAGSMSAMTALSRVTGYVRDSLQATLLGASNSTDAFVIAYRIPNMLRRLVAEGALTSAFVPTFTRYLKTQDRREVWRFVASVFYALTMLLAAIVVLGIVFSPLLVKILAYGFFQSPDKVDLTVALNRLMFPYIFFISLTALASGILNTLDVFALPAFTPVLLNLSIIGCALLMRGWFPDPAYAFAVGVLAGGTLQIAVQVPALLKHGIDLRPPRPFDRAGLREVARLILPRVFGVGITQVNLLVDSNFAASLRSGSVSFLYYATRITELTLGIFGISLSTAILPMLSRAATDRDRDGVRETLSMAMRLLIFITVPATVGVILLRVPIVHVLFERGRFSADDTLFTASALAYYSIGLLPYAAVNVQATAFYAHRDTRTPVKVGAFTFFLHLGLNFVLRGPMAHDGIALSTSLSAFADSLLLAWLLHRRVGDYFGRAGAACAARTGVASAAMAAVLLAGLRRLDILAMHGILWKATALAALITAGVGVFLGATSLMGSPELRLMRDVLRRRA